MVKMRHVPNFVKVDLTVVDIRYGDLTLFQTAAVRHLGFIKKSIFKLWAQFRVCHWLISSCKILRRSVKQPLRRYGHFSIRHLGL